MGSYTVVTKGGSVEDLSGSTSGLCSHAIDCSYISLIIEVTKSFELFKIFVLPVFSAAGNFGLHYAPLPEFLAVGEDRQIFMELTEAEVRSCQGRAGSVCPPSKAIYRKNF